MKRNKAKAREMRSGKSPYTTHQKVPYRYSPAYYSWKYEMISRVNKKMANEAKGMVRE
jgi:hypothetical protein